jgi:hypothetical protein
MGERPMLFNLIGPMVVLGVIPAGVEYHPLLLVLSSPIMWEKILIIEDFL